MKIKIKEELKNEILLTLKKGFFSYSEQSGICKILEIHMKYFEVFKSPTTREIDRECKIELIQWLQQGHIETDNSLFVTTVTPPTFLDIMKAASRKSSKSNR